jgi:hypothetical protein
MILLVVMANCAGYHYGEIVEKYGHIVKAIACETIHKNKSLDRYAD